MLRKSHQSTVKNWEDSSVINLGQAGDHFHRVLGYLIFLLNYVWHISWFVGLFGVGVFLARIHATYKSRGGIQHKNCQKYLSFQKNLTSSLVLCHLAFLLDCQENKELSFLSRSLVWHLISVWALLLYRESIARKGCHADITGEYCHLQQKQILTVRLALLKFLSMLYTRMREQVQIK